MGPVIAKYAQNLVPVALKGMVDTDPETRNNATFFCGVLMLHSGMTGIPFYPQVLNTLAPLFNDPAAADVPNIGDNAAGALARMILTATASLPLKEILPVWLQAVPLKVDFQENKMVYHAIFHLIKTSNEAMANYLPQVMSIFARSLGSPDVEAELQAEIVTIVKWLLQQYASQLQQIIGGLPQEEQQNLHKFLSA